MSRILMLTSILLLPPAAFGDQPLPKVEVGKPAPDIKLQGTDGKTFRLADKTKAGKNVALMFSRAHW